MISQFTGILSEFQVERLAPGSYHREGLCVMESREMPPSLAAWKIFPSTSMLTALVHSSSRAYLGLTHTGEQVFIIAIHTSQAAHIVRARTHTELETNISHYR